MQKKTTKKLTAVKSPRTSRNGSSLVQDKRYVRRDSKGQFIDNETETSKADKMLGKAWESTYENRKRRVG